jgi:hypothetical protein
MSSITKQTQISAWYKGSCFPVGFTDKDYINNLTLIAKKSIKGADLKGFTREEHISFLKGQLDKIEQYLWKVNHKVNQKINEDSTNYQSLAEFFPNIDECVGIWYFNIAALLELGAIKNDNNNGFLYEEKYKL